jgi:hypothetical protein
LDLDIVSLSSQRQGTRVSASPEIQALEEIRQSGASEVHGVGLAATFGSQFLLNFRRDKAFANLSGNTGQQRIFRFRSGGLGRVSELLKFVHDNLFQADLISSSGPENSTKNFLNGSFELSGFVSVCQLICE